MASLVRRLARRVPLVGAWLARRGARRQLRAEAVAALSALPRRAQDSGPGAAVAPLLLGYFPRFRTNPYQRLLYLAAAEDGIAVAGMTRVEAIDELAALQRSGTPTVLHLHWLTPVLSDASTEADGARRIDAFTARLDAYRRAGGRIAWTVHNVLPHESRWEALEIRLCRAVAERADVIHVMASGTAAAVAPFYELPVDRLLHVPHPSYAGVYPTALTREAAREALGLGHDDSVFLAFGAIRRYKGLDRLAAAWRSLPADASRRLVVAGAPLDDPGLEPLLDDLRSAPGISVDARRIPDEELPRYLLAADIAVLPYARSLNSGALLLALTFGLPVVVPADGTIAELVDPAFAVTFDPTSTPSLAQALEQARGLAIPEARAAAGAMAARFDPTELSRRFAAGLRSRLAPGGDGPVGYR